MHSNFFVDRYPRLVPPCRRIDRLHAVVQLRGIATSVSNSRIFDRVHRHGVDDALDAGFTPHLRSILWVKAQIRRGVAATSRQRARGHVIAVQQR